MKMTIDLDKSESLEQLLDDITINYKTKVKRKIVTNTITLRQYVSSVITKEYNNACILYGNPDSKLKKFKGLESIIKKHSDKKIKIPSANVDPICITITGGGGSAARGQNLATKSGGDGALVFGDGGGGAPGFGDAIARVEFKKNKKRSK